LKHGNETPQVKMLDFLSGTHFAQRDLTAPGTRGDTPPLIKHLTSRQTKHGPSKTPDNKRYARNPDHPVSQNNRKEVIDYYTNKISESKKREKVYKSEDGNYS